MSRASVIFSVVKAPPIMGGFIWTVYANRNRQGYRVSASGWAPTRDDAEVQGDAASWSIHAEVCSCGQKRSAA